MLPLTLMVHHFLVRSVDVLLFVVEVAFVEAGQHALPWVFVLEAPLFPFQNPLALLFQQVDWLFSLL